MKRGKKKLSWLTGFILVISLSMITLPANAHNLWLGLDHYDHQVGGTAKVFLYLAHSLPFADLGKPEKMKEFFYLDPSGKRKDFVLKEPDPESFFNEVGVPLDLEKEGTYMASAVMKPVFITMTPEGRKKQSKKGLSNALSCRYVEFFAKAIFHAGKPGGDAYRTVLGQTIEVVPQEDPGLLKAGDYLPVKVLFQGKPLLGAYVYATYIGFSTREEYAFTTKTGNNGIARIRITNPGIWWIKVPHKKPYEDKSECDTGQYAGIMTFEVK
ncbi:MAG: hypothetical protein C4B58_08230 [Deltaproteobacteria bacterium]|nr:MAG: hypothetical protein C4B58_08230 [Deltaproteobacteria bacterium]